MLCVNFQIVHEGRGIVYIVKMVEILVKKIKKYCKDSIWIMFLMVEMDSAPQKKSLKHSKF